MPLDGIHYETAPNLTTLKRGSEGLRQLSYVLRHPELWPSMSWRFTEVLEYYHYCGTVGCAIGVAEIVWEDASEYYDGCWSHYIEHFGMEEEQFEKIFSNSNHYSPVLDRNVTPIMVADRIDKYVRFKESEE